MLIDAQTVMQWTGCVLGVVGSFVLARNDARSGWGFVAYLASNGGWLAYGVAAELYALIVQNLVFTAISGFGVWRWLVQPKGWSCGRRQDFDRGGA